MLALDSPIWSQLNHAYGSAGDIPDLLRKLEQSPSLEVNEWAGVWKSLWESLCNGGIEVYTASYAALPHFRRIGADASLDAVWGYLLYIANVETLRLRGEVPPIPEFLQQDYLHALSTVPRWIFELSAHPWDFLLCSVAAAALSVSKGQSDLAWTLMEISPENLQDVIEVLKGFDE